MNTSLGQKLGTVTLYERLGGYPGIRRIVDGTVAAHMQNPTIKDRFLPYLDQPDRVEEIKQHTCMFFSQGSGGPQSYEGRSMTEIHSGMEIDDAEYDAAVDDIVTTMQALGYDTETREDVLVILKSLKADIIHV